jgi:hypothetical protein
VFLIKSKLDTQQLYALKVMQKSNSKHSIEHRLMEKEVGLLAKKCPFLVESYAFFANEVNLTFINIKLAPFKSNLYL